MLFVKTYGRLLAPGLTALDLELPEELTKRSPVAVAWRAFNRTLDEHFERALLAA